MDFFIFCYREAIMSASAEHDGVDRLHVQLHVARQPDHRHRGHGQPDQQDCRNGKRHHLGLPPLVRVLHTTAR